MPPTSSDGSPAIVINTPNGPIYIDSVTGEIIGAQSSATGQIATGGKTDAGGYQYFNPSVDRIKDKVDLPDGSAQITWIRPDGSVGTGVLPANQADAEYRANQIALQEKSLNATNAATGASTTNARIAAQSQANNLTEQQRQFNEQFGMDKAKYNQDFAENQRQFDAKQALTQGQTLLGLGSRPDTLTRYLYAIRGLQPPQALGGQTATLPGFSNIFATPRGAAPTAPSPAAAPSSVAPTSTTAPATTQQTSVPGAPVQLGSSAPPLTSTNFGQTPGLLDLPSKDVTTRTGYNIAPSTSAPVSGTPGVASNPNAYQPSSLGVLAKPLQVGGQQYTQNGVEGVALTNTGNEYGTPTGENISAAQAAAGPKTTVMIDGKPVNIYKRGGLLTEPVVGKGLITGQKYVFGEEAPGKPETVVPAGKTLKEVQGKAPNIPGHYASGGTIGYSPELFNPSNLGSIVQRGYNSTPDVPLLPSVGIATGGTSLIPSAQRYNSLLPSEQQSYSGFLQDEAGVQPDDISALAQKLAPKVRGLTTPRYV